jgi:hypothetical protein
LAKPVVGNNPGVQDSSSVLKRYLNNNSNRCYWWWFSSQSRTQFLSGNISGNVTSGNLAVASASTAAINVSYVDFIIANKD